MTYRIRVSRRAESQLEVASAWWSENRPKAPDAFEEEIERGFDLISSMPSVGQPVAHAELSGVRRLLLGRIRYYLYYLVQPDSKTVEILALWHASRGSSPI